MLVFRCYNRHHQRVERALKDDDDDDDDGSVLWPEDLKREG